jgi:molybdopterin synthase catalytic subunit
MRVRLLPFGVLKDDVSAAVWELPSGATVGDLLGALGDSLRAQPAASALLQRIAVSVNAEYAQASQVLREGDEVGLLPPVSGGSGRESSCNSSREASSEASPVVTYLTREPIPAGELIAAAKQGSDGAVAVFDGIVRDNTRGRRTLFLDYEAYEEMAAKQMAELGAGAIERFAVRGITLVHRLGRLQIGETSVLIVVASAHRGAAFEASRWLIDTLKKTVPIWKKETFVDGTVWADGEPFPPEFAAVSAVSAGSAGTALAGAAEREP